MKKLIGVVFLLVIVSSAWAGAMVEGNRIYQTDQYGNRNYSAPGYVVEPDREESDE